MYISQSLAVRCSLRDVRHSVAATLTWVKESDDRASSSVRVSSETCLIRQSTAVSSSVPL